MTGENVLSRSYFFPGRLGEATPAGTHHQSGKFSAGAERNTRKGAGEKKWG